MQTGSVAIIVPVYNEGASIDAFFERVDRLGYADSLIFIDNASTDDTVARIEALPGVQLIRHERNEGWGSSLRDGFDACDAEKLIVIDADLEYPPEIIPEVVAALDEHRVVHCSRFLNATPDMPIVRRVGNRLISGLYNLLYRQHTTDLCTGMRALRRSAFPLETLRFDGFDFGMEIAALLSIEGVKIHDIPIEYVPRSQDHSKMRHLPEALGFIRHIVGFWIRCVVLGRPLHPENSERGA